MPNSHSTEIGADASEANPGPDVLSPGQLALECQAGSQDAFALLVAQFHERVYNFLLAMTGRTQDAEDLTQETFLKAWQAISRFDPRFSFSTWIFTIAKRTSFNHFRSYRPSVDLSAAPEPTDGSDPSSVLSQDEDREELWRLARTLGPKHYQVLWLRYGEGFSVEELAKIAGVYPIYARVLLHRARGQLAKLLEPKTGRGSRANITQ